MKQKLSRKMQTMGRKLEGLICQDSGTVKLPEAEHGSSQQEMELSPGTAECALSGPKNHHKHHHWICNAFPSVSVFRHALCSPKCHLPSSKLPSSKNSLGFMLTLLFYFFFFFLFSSCTEFEFLVKGQRPFTVDELCQKHFLHSIFK